MHMQKTGIPMIGFTGTNGKTTSIRITKFILERCGVNPAVLDTWKGSMAYAHFLEQAQTAGKDCLLVEVPVDALRQKKLDGSVFQCGALTNLALDHLTSCRTPENYAAHKAAFFSQLPEGATALMNADDPRALALAEEGHIQYLSYAVEYQNAMVVATNIRKQRDLQAFDLTVNAEFSSLTHKLVSPGSAPVELRIPGKHNLANALLAAAVALLFIPDLHAVADALCTCPPVGRNVETVSTEHYTIIDDAATNPAAIHAALLALEPLSGTHTMILHGMYGGGGTVMNQCNARELAHWMKKHPGHELFVTRSMYHCKSKYQVRISEEKAFLDELKENHVPFAYYPDLPDAVDSLLTRANKNDLIVILGGHTLAKAKDLFLKAVHEFPPSGNTEAAFIADGVIYSQAVHHNPT